MTNKLESAVAEAHKNIQRNPHLRQEWENADTELRSTMLMDMVYNVGFDRGYEHRKKVEASGKV